MSASFADTSTIDRSVSLPVKSEHESKEECFHVCSYTWLFGCFAGIVGFSALCVGVRVRVGVTWMSGAATQSTA
eukprot:5144906-Pyramimonas_sp.AAC.1